MDKCENCIRYKVFDLEQCARCGSKNVKSELIGHSLVTQCLKCGDSVVGASFYAPCEEDYNKYSIIIDENILSNRQITRLGKLMGISAISLKLAVINNQKIDRVFNLKQIMDIIEMLKKEKISYHTDPELCYGKYGFCDRKII